MDTYNLVVFIKRYRLEDFIIEWAGIFRYLSVRKQGFYVEDWLKLSKANVDDNLAYTFLGLLEKLNLIKSENKTFVISNEIELQRSLEAVASIVNIMPDSLFEEEDKLLWTLPKEYMSIPSKIAHEFNYLNSWVNSMIQTTTSRLIFLSPYYSVAGIKQLLVSLKTLLNNKNICIDWIVSNESNADNIKAFEYIKTQLSNKYSNSKFRFYRPNDNEKEQFIFHAKLLVSDGEKGYIGSANFSKRGLDKQFELGVILNSKKSSTLSKLIDYWINNQVFVKIDI